MKIIAISLGGSIILRNDEINIEFLKGFKKLINKEKNTKFIIVTGGGFISKKYADAAALFTSSNYIMDELGIRLTRANATLVASMFNLTKIARSIDQIKEGLIASRVVVAGGLMPGISTDAVTALAAEASDCKELINISRSGGIYADRSGKGKENERNKFAKEISYQELLNYAMEKDKRTARSNFIFDTIACRIAQRSGIKLHFVGEKTEEIEKAIKGKQHVGTVVYK
jgi:uridylate kinase